MRTFATRSDPAPGLPDIAVTTYRYLRLAMVVLVVLLATSILVEWWSTEPRCWQTSLSSYYYTPVRPVLVATLVALGACLVIIKGESRHEDALLNVAGMLAPVVAFVPTAGYARCWSAEPPSRDISADVTNNVMALLVAGAAALVIALLATAVGTPADQRRFGLGQGLALALWGLGTAWFVLDRPSFEANAHYAAAVPMFGCVVVVTGLQSLSCRHSRDPRPGYARAYLVLAGLMVVVPAALGAIAWVSGWDYALLWIESALIAFFAAFWVLQTRELWNLGVRPPPGADPGLTR